MPVGSPSNPKPKSSPAGAHEETESKRILVLGGTAFIGRQLVGELVRLGHEVTIFHRQATHPLGKRVQNLTGDRNEPASIVQAVGGVRFDVVFDLAYDWVRGTTGIQVEAAAKIFDGKVGRYIFMSSVAAYGDGLNHHEGDALAPDDHPNTYIRNKAMAERALFRLYQRTGFPIVTLRPPFVYGPGNPFYREAFFWDRLRAHRPLILPSEGHRLMQFVHVRDLVELCIRAMEQRNTAGHAFNAANPRAITQHELLDELAKAAGIANARTISVPRDFLQRLGGQVMGTEKLYFGQYYDVPAITEIITKSQRMLAFKPTEFAIGLKETYKAYLKDRAHPEPDFGFEEAVINRYQQIQSAKPA